jgi:hypothetical protein
VVATFLAVGLFAVTTLAVIELRHHKARTSAFPSPSVPRANASPGSTPGSTSAPKATPGSTPKAGSEGRLGKALGCPAQSVQVSPGNIPALSANISYCFAAGTYRQLALTPLDGDGFYGQGKAILDGAGNTVSAFSGQVSDLTVDGFTIQHYASAVTYQSPGVIDLRSGSDDTVTDNDIGPDSTSGIHFGAAATCCRGSTYGSGVDNSTISHNLLHDLGYAGTAIVSSDNVTVGYNDVLHTNLFNSDTENDVAAIGKFANDDNITVVGNWVHDNNDTAIWFDVYDYAVTIRDNQVGPNNRVGIFYELSYNATIQGNYIHANGAADAGQGLGAPGAGIRVSASGYAAALSGPRGISVSDNFLTGNYEGIVLYNGHGPSIPVNNTRVTGNRITSISVGTDAWAAVTTGSGRGNSFNDNTYTVREGLFGAPGDIGWSRWQQSGFDRHGTCTTTLGVRC